MQDAICDVINEQIHKELSSSEYFSIMIDESINIAVDPNLVIYIRYVLDGAAKTVFFFIS